MINHRHTPVTLVRGQSINLTTGVVTESDNPLGVNDWVAAGLDRNNLNFLNRAFRRNLCAWTEAACHRNVETCPCHPRSVSARLRAQSTRCDMRPLTCDTNPSTDPECWHHA